MFPTIPRLLEVVSQPFKRAQLGLFHGKKIQFGNNVPFSKKKTRRTWLPNVQRKRLYSDTLGHMVRVKLTTKALRSIKKAGGLDKYLLETRHELLGEEGMRLRLAVRDQALKNVDAQQQKEEAKLSQSAEGRQILEQRMKEQTNRKHREVLKWLYEGTQPSLGIARLARKQATNALGLSGLASAQQTIEFLEEERKALAEAEAS